MTWTRQRPAGSALGRFPTVARVRARWPAAYVLSTCVAFLAGLASLTGLLVEALYAGPASVAEMLRGYDLVTLVVVVPVLVLSQL